MSIRPLTKTTADALCTIITIGFIEDQAQIRNVDDGLCTDFEYELSGNQQQQQEVMREHEEFRHLILRDAGVNVKFIPTVPARYQPYILAKPLNQDQIHDTTIINAYDQTEAFWDAMEADANITKPRGAYIGGFIRMGGFNIIGPSRLSIYMPSYRMNVTDDVYQEYDGIAVEVMNASNSVARAQRAQPANIIYVPSELTPRGGMQRDHLFGCVHGMIQAMLSYPNLENEQAHIEYSLGPGTTKVASCIPCSIFMSANGMPATATHLGRGDFWNFPQDVDLNDDMRVRWRRKISTYFFRGYKALGERMNSNPNLQIFRNVEDHGLGGDPFNEETLSQLYLEALTFPDKFTTKIINTLR